MSMPRNISRSRSRSRSRARSRSRRNVHFETKYELVDRKSDDVNIFWQRSIIILMIATTVLSLVSMKSFHSLTNSYNDRCIINAKLIFIDAVLGRIAEMDSSYGNKKLCEYMAYSPIIITTFAMFWIAMFYKYGRGGYILTKKLHFADEPWRMVLPALVSFGIASIYEIMHSITLNSYLRLFCDQLRDNYRNTDKDCGLLVEFYSITPTKSIFPNKWNYHILFHSTPWTMITCLLATLIMVCRVLLAADFQVVAIRTPRIKRRISQRYPRRSTSKEKLIFIDRNFVSSRSVHFK